ncbi:hypothetical protein FP435_04755 [Lactobacillus sp. PV037]|uniref:hypothetical protein n=1 Tax=Lactobacillus sp. PV037 TaxID=2594496 RepID=UPI0022404AD3|nr:hypothetical protein [Lactobacillus sp. PV037]QNQ83801.1 hypothetical protein FP435_04755 [Lactobacillus sp. PV037]
MIFLKEQISSVSLCISALSLILALIANIHNWKQERIQASILYKWGYKTPDSKQLTLCLLITNMSSRPNTITDLELLWALTQSEYGFKSTLFSVWLTDDGGSKTYSDCLPLNIPPRSSKTFVMVFQDVDSMLLNSIFERNSPLSIKIKLNNKEETITKPLSNKLSTQQYVTALKYKHDN